MTLPFTLQQLRSLKAVASEKSFTRAAEILFVSQPSLSKQLKLLENNLGILLINRDKNKISLTESGKLFLKYSERILALCEESCRAIKDLQNGDRGKLTVGASQTIGTYLMPRVLALFAQNYPQINLKVQVDSTRQITKSVVNRDIDIAVVGGYVPESLKKNLEIEPMRDAMDPSLALGVSKKMGTKSGLIEFESQNLKERFPDDDERPLVARYIPSWEGHDTPDLSEKYPLQLISTHVRFSYHTQYDNKSPWLDDIPVHRIKKDGYAWWPIRIHPSEAESRGIQHGDIVKMYNDRGTVLGIAQITGRVRPGVIHSFQASAKYDPLEPGKPDSIDRGGVVNLLTPARWVSKNSPGMANNSCLVEITKWEV